VAEAQRETEEEGRLGTVVTEAEGGGIVLAGR